MTTALAMTERQWSDTVVDLATTLGWKVYRTDNATRIIVRRSGARVRVRNVNAGGVGYPDLTMVRRGRVVFAELKRSRRSSYKATPEQVEWMAALEQVPGATVALWTPEDYDRVVDVLT